MHSNPSPAYLQRVVAKWDDDGSPQHVRGNLKEVIRAILLDGEARNTSLVNASPTAGKQREPLLRIAAPARTFPFAANPGTFSQSGTQVMTITTGSPHRLSTSDSIALDFTGNATGTPPVAPATNPTSAAYTVQSTPSANTFTVNASALPSVTFTQPAGSNVLTVNTSGPPVGTNVFLRFPTGGIADGFYPVASLPDATHFTITTPDTPTAARNASVLVYRSSGSYTITNTGTKFTFIFYNNHNLSVGDRFYVVVPDADSVQVDSREWTVATVEDENRITVTPPGAMNNETGRAVTFYPQVPPPFSRSGSVALAASKFDMRNTNASLGQTPLNAPTVFNFFYPDYQFPGTLAAANATTPEFQLTTDTNIVNLTNTINATILSSGNAQGLSSFANGAILLDLGAYMTAPYASFATVRTVTGNSVRDTTTTTVDAIALVNDLADRLTGGMMSAGAKDAIVRFLNGSTGGVPNFAPVFNAYGTVSPAVEPVTPLPTTCARDKARAAVQLILSSPEYAIQR